MWIGRATPAGCTVSIDARFAAFADSNPEILQTLITLARDAKSRGYKSYSLKALWEVLRYSSSPTASEKYKLPNEYTSRYARLVMNVAPDLTGFFVTKKLKDEDVHTVHTLTDDDELELDGLLW